MDEKELIDMGFLEVLTLVLFVLKLTGVIAWSWLAVLSPILIAIGFYIFLFLLVFVFGVSIFKSNKKRF